MNVILTQHIQELVAQLREAVNDEAKISAAEIVGPNAHEYEQLVDSIADGMLLIIRDEL